MKKTIISLLLVAVLAFGAGFGTLAYYTSTFNSNDNTITTAKFNPTTNDFSDTFEIPNIKPGDTEESKSFVIDTREIETSFVYDITVTNDGDLFGNNSPIMCYLRIVDKDTDKTGNYKGLNLFSDVVPMTRDGNTWTYKYIPGSGSDQMTLRIVYVWEHGENDIDFANATGTTDLAINLTQSEDMFAKSIETNLIKSYKNSATQYEFNANDLITSLGSSAKIKEATLVLYNESNKIIGTNRVKYDAIKTIKNSTLTCTLNIVDGKLVESDTLNWDFTLHQSNQEIKSYQWFIQVEEPSVNSGFVNTVMYTSLKK